MTVSTPTIADPFAQARERLLPDLEVALQASLDVRGTQATPVLHQPLFGNAASRSGATAAASARLAARHPTLEEPLPSAAPAHYGMMRYHLGWADDQLQPAQAPAGKRLRPLICLLTTEACGGTAKRAMPAAVALELLHNFTLIHDDIEDGDAFRHHRPTLWKLWGEPLAINAGDGMYILSHLVLLDLRATGVPEPTVIRLARCLAETSLTITEGQHLDLAFERRSDVTPEEYLDMIGRKSAALLSASATMGGAIGGANAPVSEALAAFGFELGMGFQIRDDILGIWGQSETTGKPAGDLRRRKKTLPTLYALDCAGESDRDVLHTLFETPEPPEHLVSAAMDVLQRFGAQDYCETMVASYSSAARRHLSELASSPARSALEALVVQLETRER